MVAARCLAANPFKCGARSAECGIAEFSEDAQRRARGQKNFGAASHGQSPDHRAYATLARHKYSGGARVGSRFVETESLTKTLGRCCVAAVKFFWQKTKNEQKGDEEHKEQSGIRAG